MRSKVLKLLFASLLLAACAGAFSVCMSAATDRVADGGYYTLKNEYCGMHLCVNADGTLGFADGIGPESLFEAKVDSDGLYTLRALGADSYLGSDELYGDAILTKTAQRYDISGFGSRLAVRADGVAEYGMLSVIEGEGGYCAVFADSSDASVWNIQEYKPESFTVSMYTATAVPYTSCTDLRAVISPASMAEYIKWTSSDRNIVIVDDDGRFLALSEGKVTLTASFGRISYTCEVEVTYENTYSWFSQNNMTTGGWNGDALYNIYFKSGSTKKRYGANDSTKKTDWMSEGCAICSIAQVLRNMGARYTNGYDFRSGIDGNVLADPFMVSLANTANRGPESGNATLKGDPVLLNTERIASSFNVNGAQVCVEFSGYVTKKTIKEALDKSPWGVVVCFKNSSYGMHYITFNKCLNPDAKDPNDYIFTVSDPASVNAGNAADVVFEESYSYKKLGYRIKNAIQIQIWSYEGQ